MFRIVNKNIYLKKNSFLTFRQVYGLNNALSSLLSLYSGLRKESSLKTLSFDSIALYHLRWFFRNHELFFENNLKRYEEQQILNLIELRSYKGMRHSLGYPVRGQRTHTNAKTKRKKHVKKSTNTKSSYLKAKGMRRFLKKKARKGRK
uniref:Ribosomal protein S13 n=1 Tax=Eukaryota sp. BB2 TaxID=1949062 RepID=A0A1W5QDH9_9EUKA|nr:ribosomal protein S13 [Eukaryota sp. BB2]AQL10432.1 ribosomal protein S13 [Eukaryota sp. BB2]